MRRALYFLLLTGALLTPGRLRAQQNANGVLPLNTTDQPYLFLVRDPVVHQDLKLTEQQRRGVMELNDKLDAAMWSMRNKTPEHIIKTLNELTATTQSRLAGLLSKDQNDRIGQIELWVLGMKALLRSDVADRLGLDPGQRGEIRDIVTTTQQEIAKLQQQLQDGGDAAALNEKFREVQVDEQTQIIAALSTAQQQQWVALLGKRIDVSQLGRVKFKAPELQFKAPELHAGSGWVNSEPLTMEKLKGKVVALHFYAFA